MLMDRVIITYDLNQINYVLGCCYDILFEYSWFKQLDVKLKTANCQDKTTGCQDKNS